VAILLYATPALPRLRRLGVNCFKTRLQIPDSISPSGSTPPEIHPWPPPPDEDPAWNLIDVLAIAAFAAFAFVVVGGLVLGFAHSLPRFRNIPIGDLAQNALVLVPAQTVAYLVVIGFMVLIIRLKRRGSFLTVISWKEPGLERALVGLAGGAALALLSGVFTELLSRWVPKSVPVEKLFSNTQAAYMLALFGVIVAPFVEEIFFRGFLYPALARRVGIGSSVALTAAFFAAVHQGQLAHAWVPLAWLFIVGLVLTLVRVRTKSVATCVLIHMAYNATLFAFLFHQTHGFRQLDRL
jgi:uncharacterized protein